MPKICDTCHNEIGFVEIHANLHILFTQNKQLVTASNNTITWHYWVNFDGLLDKIFALVQAGKQINFDSLTSLQRIDREIRNILHPSRTREKSRKMEAAVHAQYST